MKREQVSAEGGKLLKTESCCAGPGVSIEWGSWYIPFSITYQFFVFFNSFSFVFLYFLALQLVCTNGAADTLLRSYLHTVKNPWPGCSSYQHTFKCLALAHKASPKIVKGLKNEKGYNLQGMQNLPPCDWYTITFSKNITDEPCFLSAQF